MSIDKDKIPPGLDESVPLPPITDCSPSQQAFLRNRHAHKSDSQCAKALGILPNTVYRWKEGRRNSEFTFVSHYNRMMANLDRVIEEYEDPDFVMRKLAPKARQRYEEALNIHIVPDLDKGIMAQVLTAATNVLKGVGDFKSENESSQSIHLWLQNYQAEGQQYQPPWLQLQRQEALQPAAATQTGERP